MELYTTEARKLDIFISENLQPNEEFLGHVRQAVDILCQFLRENCFKDAAAPRPRVLKVVKGGSVGNGTAIKGGSDVDLVVFLNIFKDYKDQETKLKEIVQEIGRKHKEFTEENGKHLDVTLEASKWLNPRVISFTLCSYDPRDSIELNVLPAFDALGQYKKGSKPDPQVYIDLINSTSSSRGGEFSTCFTELQKDFIVARPPKLKSLIRLLKHWYKEYVCLHKAKLRSGESLPPKYALELLAVYAWEQGSGETDFDTEKGFRTVLWLLQQYRQLCVFWTMYYDFENEILKSYLLRQLQKPRPVILDPADPTGIVGEGSRWDLLAQEAERCSRQKCCLPYWDVPVRSKHTQVPFWGCSPTPKIYGAKSIREQKLKEEKKLLSGVVGKVLGVGDRGVKKRNCSEVSVLLPCKAQETETETFFAALSSAMGLYETDAGKLDKFIFDHLQPNEEFLGQVRRAIDKICKFLRENCFKDAAPPRPRVLKVIKGGSSGKGTALKGGSDADLVVFLSIFKAYTDQEHHRKEIIQEIERRLKEFKNKEGRYIDVTIEPSKWPNPRVLSFTLRSFDLRDSIEFDVLPAFDALGQRTGLKPHPQVYIDLIDSSSRGGEFSTCFTELQRDFIIDRPTKLKSLIRLLKHWYKEYVNVYQYKSQLQSGESLPPKYALELLAVYAWEQGSQDKAFDMAKGFRTVLWLLLQHRQLCIFWTKYYNFENATVRQYLTDQLQKSRPVILDPADPTGLLGEGCRWDLLAQEAEHCLGQKCCTHTYVPSAFNWDVPLQVSWEEAAMAYEVRVAFGSCPARPPPFVSVRETKLLREPRNNCRFPALRAVSFPGRKRKGGPVAGLCVPFGTREPAMLSAARFPAMELYDTDASKLDKFIVERLQPNAGVRDQMLERVGDVCEFLRDKCFRDAAPPRPRVLKAVKGGSSGKGTALKEGSDADLVVFLSIFKGYTDQQQYRKEIIQEIEKRLREYKNKEGESLDVNFEPSKWPNPRVLSFTLPSRDLSESIEFDVLPAFDALGHFQKGSKPDPQVYVDLIVLMNSGCCRGGEFSTCFTELQKDFIIARPTKLKSLIRLLKHWYKKYVNVNQYKSQLRSGESLPPKYALELLAVYAWEQGSQETDFDMAKGFRTVLWLLQQHSQLCIFWTTYYDFGNETLRRHLISQLRKPKPVILDPADPTGLLGEGSRWDLLVQEAERCSRQKCCTNNYVSSAIRWDVPLQVSWKEEARPNPEKKPISFSPRRKRKVKPGGLPTE
ncbi:2'-5'-oligoadenylate synthase 3 [Eublepharis macularius]|uniref:2'-5' oligoadenylate synthase n=1 Tax=Eublepharis macularius TaxID=481883 RepID=A0AA97KB03_EUBMA|nr:2'-5'-oligoadenylate synthase 3 [Eublepharis macularius]